MQEKGESCGVLFSANEREYALGQPAQTGTGMVQPQ